MSADGTLSFRANSHGLKFGKSGEGGGGAAGGLTRCPFEQIHMA